VTADDQAFMHWAAVAQAAWLAYMDGDDGVLEEALNATENFRAACDRLKHPSSQGGD
jgi:hypothetical protein